MSDQKKQLKILFITYTFSNQAGGGEARIAWEQINALARIGVKVYVAAIDTDQVGRNIHENIKIYKVPFGTREIGFTRGNMLKAFLFTLPWIYFWGVDIIHVGPNNIYCPYTRFKIRPVVMDAHMPWPYDNPKFSDDLRYDRSKKSEEAGFKPKRGFWKRVWEKIAYTFFYSLNIDDNFPKAVDVYFCRSHELINYLRSSGYNSKLAYVPSGVNPEFFNSNITPAIVDEKFKFLFAGRISRRKGVGYMIRAFNEIGKRFPNSELLLVGDGAPSTVADMRKMVDGKVRSRVKFIGHIPPLEVNKYLASADVFVLPSLGEPFGIVNLEAMFCGKPVISTNSGGVPDYFRDGEIGFLVEPADEKSLSQVMKKFLQEPGLSEQLGRQAKEYVVGRYTWEQTARNILTYYHQLV